MTEPKHVCEYSEGETIFQVSKPWSVCIGDGINWSKWHETDKTMVFHHKKKIISIVKTQ